MVENSISEEDIARLDPSERIFIDRRRRNMTQADFGQLFGLHQTTIAHIETGRIDPLSHLADHLETSDMPAELSELTDGERLSVLRRRKGWEVKQVAEIAGIHPRYITMFEHDKKETPVEILALVMDLPLLP